ncbi:ABC transporter ATP-binding protein [Bradyrhizobium sp. USDA 10063]
MTALGVENLSIGTPTRGIVNNICLQVAHGEIIAILGETGSGKSMIGSAIMGLVPRGMEVSGRIVVNDRVIAVADTSGLRRLWSSDLFLLPQEPLSALAPLLKASSQVAEQIAASANVRRRLAADALAAMHLQIEHHGKRPHELSGGMAQRVMAAIASVTRARILVADEPTKGLDADRRDAVAEMFNLLKNDGRAIVLITHDIALVRQVADRIAFLDDSRIVEEGPSAQVLGAPASDYARRYVRSDPRSWTARPYVRSSTPKVLEVEDLRIGVAGRVLAENVNFHCHAGHIAALLGESGIGKTTLGRTILGLSAPMAGAVRRRFAKTRPDALAIQKLHQDPTRVFSPWQSIGRSMQDLIRLPGGQDAVKAIRALMRRFGLNQDLLDRLPGQISGGEAQRLALTRILALRPHFLIADEPTSRLDPPVQAEVIRHLRETADEGDLAILLITHDRELAEAVADRCMLMSADTSAPARLRDITRRPVGADRP